MDLVGSCSRSYRNMGLLAKWRAFEHLQKEQATSKLPHLLVRENFISMS
jgi:hypothetical protein